MTHKVLKGGLIKRFADSFAAGGWRQSNAINIDQSFPRARYIILKPSQIRARIGRCSRREKGYET
jgi:hypothetical protein